MKKCDGSVVLLLILGFGLTASAADTDSVEEENAALVQKIDTLETRVQTIMQSMQEAPSSSDKPTHEFFRGLDDQALQELAEKLAAIRDDQKMSVWSSLDIRFYGFLRLDAAYDDSQTLNGAGGSWMRWVRSESRGPSVDEAARNDDALYATAQWTRLGVNVTCPATDSLVTSGKVELDLYDGASHSTSPNPRLRLAYVKLNFNDSNTSLLAGQNWDVLSPLAAPTIDVGGLWNSGNIGARRPMIALAHEIEVADASTVQLEGALTQNFGGVTGTVGDHDIGNDSGLPQIQGRIGIDTDLLGGIGTSLGISGHWGRMEYDLTNTGKNKKLNTWSLSLDLVQHFTESFSIRGEIFQGSNLSGLVGGISQRVNKTVANRPKEIDCWGGWFALCTEPIDHWAFNAGYGIDNPSDSDLSAVANVNRSENSVLFGNCIYTINNYVDVGFELSYWKTEYIGLEKGKNLRGHFMMRFRF